MSKEEIEDKILQIEATLKVLMRGLRMTNPAIEAFGFEFLEYSGNQVYNL